MDLDTFNQRFLKASGYDPEQFEVDPNGEIFAKTQPAEMPTQSAKADEPSPTGSFLRSTAAEAVPATGALAAAGGGSLATAGILGALGAPETFGMSLIPFIVGLGSGAVAHHYLKEGQDKLLPDSAKETLAQDAKVNPMSSKAGSIAANMLTMRPSPSMLRGAVRETGALIRSPGMVSTPALKNIALGAGLGGTQEAVEEKFHGQDLDPKAIAESTALGALLHQPTRLGTKVSGFAPHIPSEDHFARADKATEGENVSIPAPTPQDAVQKFLSNPEVQDRYDFEQNPGLIETAKTFADLSPEDRVKKAEAASLAADNAQKELFESPNGDPEKAATANQARDFLEHLNSQLNLTEETIASPREGKVKQAWVDMMRNWATRKFGVGLEVKSEVLDSEGTEVAGKLTPKSAELPNALAEISIKGDYDTYPHEVFHAVIDDIRTHGSDSDRAFLSRALDAFDGSEESLTQAVGEHMRDRVLNKNQDKVLSDLGARVKDWSGKAGQEDYARLGSSLLRYGAGTERLQNRPIVSTNNQEEKQVQYQRFDPKIEKPRLRIPDIFTSVTDRLKNSGDPSRELMAKKFEDLLNHSRELKAKYSVPIQEALNKLSKPEQVQLHEILYDENASGINFSKHGIGPTSIPVNLHPAYDTIRGVLDKIAKDQIASGQLINGRVRGNDPSYYPGVVNPKVRQVLANKQGSPDFNRLKQDYIDLNTRVNLKRGHALPEAQDLAEKSFDKYLGAFSAPASIADSLSFKAVRSAESGQTPESWMHPDIKEALDSYVSRVAKDRSFYDVMEKDPQAMSLLGSKTFENAQPIPPHAVTKDHITADPNVHSFLSDYLGFKQSKTPALDAVGRVVNAAIVSNPITRGTDYLTTAFKALPYVGPTEAGKMFSHVFSNYRQTYENSLASGLNSAAGHSFLHETIGAADTVSGKLYALADALTHYTGSEWIEKHARTLAQGVGEYIAQTNCAAALAGDAKAQKFMEHQGSDWRHAPIDMLGGRVGRIFQGKFDLSNQPDWLKNSSAAPFMSLMRWNIEQWNNFKRYAIEPITNPAIKGRPDFAPMLATIFAGTIGGLGIEELRQKLTGRKDYIASFQELANAPDKGRSAAELAAKLSNAAQLTGVMGIISEFTKQGIDVLNHRMPQGFRFPAYDLTAGNFQTVSSAISALNEGEPWDAVLKETMGRLMNDNLSVYRVASNIAATTGIDKTKQQQNASRDSRRDLTMFDSLSGQPQEMVVNRKPEIGNTTQRKFQQETDPKELIRDAMILRKKALQKYKETGDPAALKQALSISSNTASKIMPSPQNDPQKFAAYYRYIKATQGDDKAKTLLLNYSKSAGMDKVRRQILK